ncbi:hypothetical protein PIB30_107632, partial [Stylosanthes scabra]|nr:hypothetical protein [Stylosanthes scabra]
RGPMLPHPHVPCLASLSTPQRGSYPVLPCLHYHPQTAPYPRLNMPPTRSFLHISSLSHPHLLPQV